MGAARASRDSVVPRFVGCDRTATTSLHAVNVKTRTLLSSLRFCCTLSLIFLCGEHQRRLPLPATCPRRSPEDLQSMAGLFDARQAAAASAAARDAAGKPTNKLNASFSAFDYAPAKLDNARSFLMDDYLQSGRIARKREEPTRDRCWDVLHYQKDVVPFEPRQGFSETKFHSGFMRRQGSQIAYLQQRVRPLQCLSQPARNNRNVTRLCARHSLPRATADTCVAALSISSSQLPQHGHILHTC